MRQLIPHGWTSHRECIENDQPPRIWFYLQLTSLGKRSAGSVMVYDCAVEMTDIEVQYLELSDMSNLKIIRICTGNQCNSFRTGVIESNFRVYVIILAAACLTICTLWMSDNGSPYSTELPLSNLDVTNAWKRCLAASAVIYFRMSLINSRC